MEQDEKKIQRYVAISRYYVRFLLLGEFILVGSSPRSRGLRVSTRDEITWLVAGFSWHVEGWGRSSGVVDEQGERAKCEYNVWYTLNKKRAGGLDTDNSGCPAS